MTERADPDMHHCEVLANAPWQPWLARAETGACCNPLRRSAEVEYTGTRYCASRHMALQPPAEVCRG